MYKINFSKVARKQAKILARDKKKFLKLVAIVEDIKQNPYSPLYNFKALTGTLQGYYSKRLNYQDRVLYRVEDKVITVEIQSVLGHY